MSIGLIVIILGVFLSFAGIIFEIAIMINYGFSSNTVADFELMILGNNISLLCITIGLALCAIGFGIIFGWPLLIALLAV